MIVLRRLANIIRDVCILSGRVAATSGYRMYLYQASSKLRRAFDATKHRFDPMPQWNEYEVMVAETIIWLIAFLDKIGCVNIEQLIVDVIAYRTAHPDYSRMRH